MAAREQHKTLSKTQEVTLLLKSCRKCFYSFTASARRHGELSLHKKRQVRVWKDKKHRAASMYLPMPLARCLVKSSWGKAHWAGMPSSPHHKCITSDYESLNQHAVFFYSKLTPNALPFVCLTTEWMQSAGLNWLFNTPPTPIPHRFPNPNNLPQCKQIKSLKTWVLFLPRCLQLCVLQRRKPDVDNSAYMFWNGGNERNVQDSLKSQKSQPQH